ncbi:MAG: helix-turn-helix transcriptional regulator [Sphingomonas sp.]|jgi:transcriptional regulator with XRE-family HTH domain|uniref:hypothetical protein n=1 Tax=Sphingomonas sp. TaxID=28214 RepID=UPI00356ACF1C
MDDSDFISSLADKLRRIRRDGLATQKDIETATGIRQETISKVINGKRHRRNATLIALNKYADMLILNPKVSTEVTDAVVEFLTFGTEADLVASIRMCASLASGRPLNSK